MERRVVDVLVLGCGAAGATAALTARRRGADVLVVERARPEAHTPNVRLSGGYVMTVVDRQDGRRYLEACAGEIVDTALFGPWADRASAHEKWLAGINVELELCDTETWGLTRADAPRDMWVEHPDLPGAGSIRVSRTATTLPAPFPGRGPQATAAGRVIGGEALYRGLMHGLANEGVEIVWETMPARLTVEAGASSRVTGAVLVGPDGTRTEVEARAGVILTTGGYGANPETIKQFLPVPNTRFYGNPGNDASGLKLAQAAGADLVRMNRMVGRGIASFDLPSGTRLGFMVGLSGGGYLLCDQDGHRYADEYELATHQHDFYFKMERFDEERGRYPRSPSYWLFDEKRRRSGPLTFLDRGVCAVGLYDWSEDNQQEIESGWIGAGDSPSAAAHVVGADPGVDFDQAVADYNAACRSGTDEFGRPLDTLVPLVEPPFYCMPLYIGGPYTTGGVRRDARGQVSSVFGEPIPGFFSAGELGQAIGLIYPASGAGLSEAMSFAEIAAESITSLTHREAAASDPSERVPSTS